ncbi:enediyne biosynthesis protein UnbU [Streptosporangium sp. NPDC004631]
MTPAQRRSRALRRFAGSLTATTVLGHCLLGFEQAYLAPLVGVATGVTTELVLETVEAWARGRRVRYLGRRAGRTVDFFLPCSIDGLLCAMLLYGDAHLGPVALAVLIGVGGKYVFRVGMPGRSRPGGGGAPGGACPGEGVPGRHYLNPVALGTCAVLLLFPWVGTAPPYQFTERVSGPFDAIVPLVLLVLGTTVHAKLTGRLPLILGWTGGFVLQGLVRGALSDISVISALLPMTGVAFVLHTVYVIADPGTTPAGTRNQIGFGLATAAVYGLLVQFHLVYGLLFSLVIVCACRGAYLATLSRVRPPAVPTSIPVPAPSPSPAPALGHADVPAGVQR